MEVLFDHRPAVPPKVSIVLLDWSCRESFHTLHYLNRQTVPRNIYEVIWIEYYRRQARQLEEALRESERVNRPPILDRWIVMGIPENVYYHKHLMYNVGIVVSRGEIVTLCDSDAMMRPTFVESILREFERDPNIVLHMDQVRSNNRRFYPFNYPTFEEVMGPGAINWTGTTTTGQVDTEDPLHSRNYGACMSARREALIAIGGADEHVDYVGHICGPYELTFRLVNAGHREVWHESEFLYHTWHPGQAGDRNYLGPHDGRHMSTTALEVRVMGRVRPLVENSAIQTLRLEPECVEYAPLLAQVIPEADLESWTVERLKQQRKSLTPRELLGAPRVALLLAAVAARILVRQVFQKTRQLSRHAASTEEKMHKALKAYRFVGRTLHHTFYIVQRARRCVEELRRQGVHEVAVFGATDVAEILRALTLAHSVRISAIYDEFRNGRFLGREIQPPEGLAESTDKVVVASIVDVERRVAALQRLGVAKSRIVIL